MSAAARTFVQSSLNVTTETVATTATACLAMKATATIVRGFHKLNQQLLTTDRLTSPAATALRTLTVMTAFAFAATVSSETAKNAE